MNDYKLTLQPFVIVVLFEEKVAAAYVIINDEKYQFQDVTNAIAFCWKSFFVLDAAYPVSCEAIWIYIEEEIYVQYNIKKLWIYYFYSIYLKKMVYKISGMYISLPCLPLEFRSKLDSIFLLQIVHSIALIIGDNLGLNSILGFTTSFNSNFFCRFLKFVWNDVLDFHITENFVNFSNILNDYDQIKYVITGSIKYNVNTVIKLSADNLPKYGLITYIFRKKNNDRNINNFAFIVKILKCVEKDNHLQSYRLTDMKEYEFVRYESLLRRNFE
ncbi:hypothetical protein ALC60_07489 [Trachymyrmex zeteki]|uniref:Uncharacterized protein n=1 Tax=Mycetomoellerius zeteki TaxID=64791 RepID=A0A151WZP4_9HYME|nr:hypothetical protein ALC60_07489 [Trachymyrmex zeteki]